MPAISIGYHPDGRVAFQSRNLRGLRDYARKHTISSVEIGGVLDGAGRNDGGTYTATFSNGVTCKGHFADERIMLGFFLGMTHANEIICCRLTFNKGTAMGNIHIPFMCSIGRDGTARFGPWDAVAYRDEHTTALVRFTRR